MLGREFGHWERISPSKGLILSFFSSPLSKKPPPPCRTCTAPKGDTGRVALLFCLHPSCTPESKTAGFLLLKCSWRSGAFAGGAAGCRSSIHPVCRARHTHHSPPLPSSGAAERRRHGVGFFSSVPPFLLSLHAGGGGEPRQRKKGGSTLKLWPCFPSGRTKTFC